MMVARTHGIRMMPNWLLPLLGLIVLGSFVYFGFWKGLSNRRDENNRNNDGSGSETLTGGHSSSDSHHH